MCMHEECDFLIYYFTQCFEVTHWLDCTSQFFLLHSYSIKYIYIYIY